jgi:hypothetical protein
MLQWTSWATERSFRQLLYTSMIWFVLLASPRSVFADVYWTYDAVWGAEEVQLGEQPPPTPIYAAHITDGDWDHYPILAVLSDSNASTISYNYVDAWGNQVEADASAWLDWWSSPEGDYHSEGDHYVGDNLFSIFGIPIGVGRISTRYIFSQQTPEGLWEWHPFFCGNRCEKPWEFTGQFQSFPPNYLQGQGFYVCLGDCFCKIGYSGRGTPYETSCNPPN